MDTGLDFFNAWAKTQKQFLETSIKSQEAFRAQWLESMKKTQESFVNLGGAYDNPQSQAAVKLFNTWLSNMISSSELVNDQLLKIEQSWEKTLELQIEQSKELATVFAEFLKQVQAKPPGAT